MSASSRLNRLAPATATAFVAAMFMLQLPAHAADLSVKAPVFSPVAVYNWTGLYGGANFGGVFNTEDVTTPLGIFSTDPSGAVGGFQAGYNYQFSSWLIGVE